MNLKDKLESELSSINYTLKLLEEFPDLHEHFNRWKQRRLSSKYANNKVTDVEIRHNCGCCDDSPLEVWPYLNIGNIRVYSDPTVFSVGHKCYWKGDTPNPNWQKQLIDNNIPLSIIDKIQIYFENNDPNYEEKNDLD